MGLLCLEGFPPDLFGYFSFGGRPLTLRAFLPALFIILPLFAVLVLLSIVARLRAQAILVVLAGHGLSFSLAMDYVQYLCLSLLHEVHAHVMVEEVQWHDLLVGLQVQIQMLYRRLHTGGLPLTRSESQVSGNGTNVPRVT
ncbi:uncharacterized protein DS421_10g296580 [Arachis hypogaea]|nr:uncharacterized protein DS421_10g296580 [Arachis hypogaea]